jgi:hypothetical protein
MIVCLDSIVEEAVFARLFSRYYSITCKLFASRRPPHSPRCLADVTKREFLSEPFYFSTFEFPPAHWLRLKPCSASHSLCCCCCCCLCSPLTGLTTTGLATTRVRVLDTCHAYKRFPSPTTHQLDTRHSPIDTNLSRGRDLCRALIGVETERSVFFPQCPSACPH